jgi:predicted tellurium resistance membrane protein TerC
VSHAAFWPVVAQIVALDLVFSLDSVITAVGMVDELYVMMAAVIVAVGAMLVAARPLTKFITERPSLIVLCLSFLLMIGLVLVIDRPWHACAEGLRLRGDGILAAGRDDQPAGVAAARGIRPRKR